MNIKENHLHIEGANIKPSTYKEIVEKAKKIYKQSPKKRKTFQEITKKDPLKLNLTNKQEKFTFQKFLEKLYIAKLCLSSTPKIAKKFCQEALEYHQKSLSTIGITPSIPSYFPHINKLEWYEATTSAINQTFQNKENTTLVIETKRSNLKNKVYLQNIEFIKYLNRNLNKNIRIAIGLCGDAKRNPLSTTKIQKHYQNYIKKSLNINPNIKIQVHELEQKNPPEIAEKEINFLFKFFNKNEIYQVNWIHMCHLVEISKTFSPSKIKEILTSIKDRNDKIIISPTSNKILNNPFLLKDKNIVKQILKKDIKLSLGTDDPAIFGIKTIEEEYQNLKKVLQENGYNKTTIEKILYKIKSN